MKNLIPETKRSLFKIMFHVFIFTILLSMLLITTNKHVEQEKIKDERYEMLIDNFQSELCKIKEDLSYIKAKKELEYNNEHK